MEASKFHHPFKPYDIQLDLMRALYGCIEDCKVGVFESPTGTGKSLSLICASMAWLRQKQSLHFQSVGANSDDGVPEWVKQHALEEQQRQWRQRRQAQAHRLQRIRERQEISRSTVARPSKRSKTVQDPKPEEFELADYESDQAEQRAKVPHVSSSNFELMQQLGLTARPQDQEDDDPRPEIKIFFSSRTHSQLTQFVHEIRRLKLPAEKAGDDSPSPRDEEVIKHVSLGSRKNLCINEDVLRLGSVTAINERCVELQQGKGQKCAYIPSELNKSAVTDFQDHALANIHDIEDFAGLGKRLGICPYYASRAAIAQSEKSAREALDIDLTGHIVIIDEAHNLMDTISGLHSMTLTARHLKQSKEQILLYLQKFRNHLKGKNRVYIAQTIRLLDSISLFLQTRRVQEGIMDARELLAGKGMDQVNLHKILSYLQESRLARKVSGYAQSCTRTMHEPVSTPALFHVQSFLNALNNPAPEGRFFFEKDEHNEYMLKYLLLDPRHVFQEVVQGARAVILAGGTMSPLASFADQLFPYLKSDRVLTWQCGHVVPRENIAAIPVRGHGDVEFEFTFEKRKSPVVMKATGQCLVELVRVVPDGVVVFFPSYAYMDQMVASWQKGDAAIWSLLQKQKPIFQESKTNAMDILLADYSLSVSSGKGGLLLSVIGGKLSEGINFSDSLGRCVVVVGLPFPNAQSVQWQAKLEYVVSQERARSESVQSARQAGRDFAEDACMRAVNQSIGRAIRHRSDYASVVLLDRRYSSSRIQSKLPGWIQASIVDLQQISLAASLSGFFANVHAKPGE